MSQTGQAEAIGRPRISVSVLVEYSIDPRGTAKVRDVKTIKNDGDAAANLSGEFKQAVNYNVSQMRIADSRSPDNRLPYVIKRGDDHHQVAVAIEVPDGQPFVVEAGTERSLVFEYEMSDSTTILADGPESTFLIKNRFGSVTYRYDFATIEYDIKYHIEKLPHGRWWEPVFQQPSLLFHPPDMVMREDRTHFHVGYKFSCDAKAIKHVHIALTQKPRYWVQWATAFLVGAAASAVVAAAPYWLRLTAKLLDGS